MGISDAFIKASQALSNKWGIPTFDLSGNVLTVPTNKMVGPINVGVGSPALVSQGVNSQTLSAAINQVIAQVKNTVGGGTIGATYIPGLPSGAPTGNTGGVNPPPSSAPAPDSTIQNSGDTLKKGFESIKNYVGPAGLVIGALIIGVVLLRR